METSTDLSNIRGGDVGAIADSKEFRLFVSCPLSTVARGRTSLRRNPPPLDSSRSEHLFLSSILLHERRSTFRKSLRSFFCERLLSSFCDEVSSSVGVVEYLASAVSAEPLPCEVLATPPPPFPPEFVVLVVNCVS